jgi:hypothetical protein
MTARQSDSRFAELARRASPGIAGAIAMIAYLVTLSREAGWGDSAELTLQACRLGVTHAPGYPLHTLVGRLFTGLFPDPAIAVNLLSAAGAAAAAALSAWILRRGGLPALTSVLAALAFAFMPVIWGVAVETETYDPNIGVLAGALVLLLAWRDHPSWKGLALAAAVFGLSLGSYLANALLYPALLYLVLAPAGARLRRGIVFSAVFALAGGAILSWSCLRSFSAPPLGTTYVPDTLPDFVRFLSAVQYNSLRVPTATSFIHGALHHGKLLCRGFAWVGVPLGLLGIVAQWKRDRDLCISLLALFTINIVYFTGLGSWEYYNMSIPSYFVFALWIGEGAAALRGPGGSRTRVVLSIACQLAVVALLLMTQLPKRYEAAQRKPVERFVLSSLGGFPRDAVIVADWDVFAALCYYQDIRGLRRDLTMIENTPERRTYSWGVVDGFSRFVEGVYREKPVLAIGYPESVRVHFRVEPAQGRWVRIVGPADDRGAGISGVGER